jgi:hypothetical protein
MSEIKLNLAHRAEDNSSSIVRVCRKVSDEIKRLIHARATITEERSRPWRFQ